MASVRSFSKSNGIINGGVVANSSISTSTLDMNSQRITSVALPVNSTDASNKAYVDSLNIQYYTINLNGTAPTTINSSLLTGSYSVQVTSAVPNGPSATFHVSKNMSASIGGSIMRFTSGAGAISNERLLVVWNSNNGIQLMKTGVNYNGSYIVKIS